MSDRSEPGGGPPGPFAAEIAQLLNGAVMSTDFARAAGLLAAGGLEGGLTSISNDDLTMHIIFPMVNGLRDAVLRIAAEIDDCRRQL